MKPQVGTGCECNGVEREGSLRLRLGGVDTHHEDSRTGFYKLFKNDDFFNFISRAKPGQLVIYKNNDNNTVKSILMYWERPKYSQRYFFLTCGFNTNFYLNCFEY